MREAFFLPQFQSFSVRYLSSACNSLPGNRISQNNYCDVLFWLQFSAGDKLSAAHRAGGEWGAVWKLPWLRGQCLENLFRKNKVQEITSASFWKCLEPRLVSHLQPVTSHNWVLLCFCFCFLLVFYLATPLLFTIYASYIYTCTGTLLQQHRERHKKWKVSPLKRVPKKVVLELAWKK